MKTTDQFTLYKPNNSWDMNYRILDNNNNIEYLIDVCDVSDTEEDGYLSFSDLIDMSDMDKILSFAWKSEEFEPISFS